MLSITPGKQIKDIQQEFSHAFPYLKLEFSTSREAIPGRKHSGSNEQGVVASVGYDKAVPNAEIYLTPGTTVLELERKCQDLFGISVQVYRRFRRVWLKATMTENFTLQQQNDHGSEISLNMS